MDKKAVYYVLLYIYMLNNYLYVLDITMWSGGEARTGGEGVRIIDIGECPNEVMFRVLWGNSHSRCMKMRNI